MLRRIRKRDRVSPGRRSSALVVALAACVMFCAIESGYAGESNAGDGAYPADSTGNSVKTTTGVERSESLHVLDATPTDLRGIIETLRAPRTGSGCANWADPDSLAGILVPLPGAAWLLVGDSGDASRGTSEWSIGDLQRKYRVIRYSRSSSPLAGEIVFMVREADAEAERRCVRRLRGVAVQWLHRAGDPGIVPNAGKMVVREVRFARAAVIGPAGEPVATGDTVVKLSLAEGWIWMAWREMKAQRWGIAVGVVVGVLLTILTILTRTLTRIGAGMLCRIRKLKVLNRSNREESVEDAERQNEEDEGPGNACPTCRDSVRGDPGLGEKEEGV